MANYIASDTDLTAVANAIRTKGGTSAELEFPSGFVSAVQAIPSGGKLWRVRQTHISQIQYPPSIDTAALYTEIEKPGEGDSIDNPIIYNGNMKLILGKYYKQNDVVYYYIRDTGNPVYNNLSDLIDIYVEVAH